MEQNDILKSRAAHLATPIVDNVKAEDLLELLEFTLGKETYGIEITFTKEISSFSKCSELPNTPDFIVGVINLRQRIISIVDLKKVLNIPSSEDVERTQVIVIKKNTIEYGLLVDKVIGTKKIYKNTLQSVPSTFVGLQKDLLKGLTQEKTIVLNGETFFNKNYFIVNNKL